jgi:hypothetical protein
MISKLQNFIEKILLVYIRTITVKSLTLTIKKNIKNTTFCQIEVTNGSSLMVNKYTKNIMYYQKYSSISI